MKKVRFVHKKAFTIVEVLIVIAVIGILIGISIPRLKGMKDEGNYAKAKSELKTLVTAIESFRSHSGAYPAALSDVTAPGVLPKIVTELPIDPFTSGLDYGYAKSPNDLYYVLYSVGFDGQPTIGGINDTGYFTGSVGDDIYISNSFSGQPGSLIFGWSMDEGSGTTVGEGILQGTIMPGLNGALADWVSGRVGDALSFDGQGSHVSVPDSNELDLTTEGTISAWVYVDSIPPYAGIVHKGDNINFADEAYSLQFWGDRPALFINPTGTANYTQGYLLTAGSALQLGSWNHIVGTWDPSGMRVYINGELSSSNTVAAVAQNSTGSLNIGSQTATNQTYGSWGNLPYDGAVDEVQIYRRSLSAQEISAYYNSTR